MINLMQGDCLELMKTIPDGSVDLILTDPPYGTTACKWDSVIPFEPMWEQLKRIIKPNGAIVLFGSEPFSSALRMSNIKQYKYDWKWNKENGGNFAICKYMPHRVIEDIIVFSKSKSNYYPIMDLVETGKIRPVLRERAAPRSDSPQGIKKLKPRDGYDNKKRFPKNLLTFNSRCGELNSANRSHPTQKPVALLEYLIKTYTQENETVLDFTAGSMSTAIACINTNRKGIMIEKDPHYFKVGSERVERALSEKGD